MALNRQQLLTMLHHIVDNTCDGDNRSKAQNWIVQLSVRNCTSTERTQCETFIDEAMKEFDTETIVSKHIG